MNVTLIYFTKYVFFFTKNMQSSKTNYYMLYLLFVFPMRIFLFSKIDLNVEIAEQFHTSILYYILQ